jgi:hypothetical protein
MGNIKYEAPYCATFSILLLLHPCLVQIFFLEPCSQTPSVCALPLMWETKFHTHTEQLTELWLPFMARTFVNQQNLHYMLLYRKEVCLLRGKQINNCYIVYWLYLLLMGPTSPNRLFCTFFLLTHTKTLQSVHLECGLDSIL